MAGKRGRRVRAGLRIWRNPEVLERRVKTIVARRDKENEETVTDVGLQLTALARRILGRPVTAEESARLLKLAPDAKPSQITRTLLSWRFALPDRTVRVMARRTVIMEARWA